jgi:3-deoxy-D-manno-octulosonate 8-phosphate phosphatase KdsC-like HAD superfamily phosphatase
LPLYYFNTADGTREMDQIGTELADRNAACHQAIRFIGDVMSDEPELLANGSDFRVEVMDAEKRVLFTVVACTIEGVTAE